MLGWLRNLFASRAARKLRNVQWQHYVISDRFQRIKAKYDAAQTGSDNSNHWANADGASAAAANVLSVRTILRNRSRYEVANNCHARGITLTVANDLIGTGARLQVQIDDDKIRDAIEARWSEWADEIHLAEKLHTLTLASVVDGEGVGLIVNNPTLLSSVQLDLRVVDCDQLTTPLHRIMLGDMLTDGIEYDNYGNPTVYHFLKYHPGDVGYYAMQQDYDRVPARNVLHFFRHDRPGQLRGIPEITPALPLFAQLRRYTLAVLMSAEIAADFSIFISTDQPAEDGSPVQPFDTTDIDKGMLTALPEGYKPFQLHAEQPTTMHDAFCKTLLREAAHCMNIPYNVATGDFSQDSYAGGRMALQVYQRFIKVRRKHFASRVLNKLFLAWLDEAQRIPKYLPSMSGSVPFAWFFDGWQHVDPTKGAQADQVNLSNMTTTLADLCAENGTDWRKVIRQRGVEVEMQRKENILILPPGTPPLDGAESNTGTEAANAA